MGTAEGWQRIIIRDQKMPFVLASDNVKVTDLNRNVLGVLSLAGNIHEWLFHKPLVVTSGNDGTHTADSKHYKNLAADVRRDDKLPEENMLFLMILTYIAHARGCAVFDEWSLRGEPQYHVERAN